MRDVMQLLGQTITCVAMIGKCRVHAQIKVLDARQVWGRTDVLICSIRPMHLADGDSCWVSLDSLVIVK